MDTPIQLGLFDFTHLDDTLTAKEDPLEQLTQHIPWARFRKTLEKSLCRSKRPKAGRPPFDAVLSPRRESEDSGCQDHLAVRKTLVQAGVAESLFTQFQFNAYLAEQALQARGGQPIDVSLIPVPKQRNTREEHATIKAGECQAEWETPAKRCQKDTDVRWTKKHGVSHFRYENDVNMDKQHNQIRRHTVTDATMYDSQILDEVLQSKTEGRGMWADVAYRSDEIEDQFKKRKLRSRIQYKGYQDKPLTSQQQYTNQRLSRIRAATVSVFGQQVMAMGCKLIRTIGRVRARANKIRLRISPTTSNGSWC